MLFSTTVATTTVQTNFEQKKEIEEAKKKTVERRFDFFERIAQSASFHRL
jgi:hypothetical protein